MEQVQGNEERGPYTHERLSDESRLALRIYDERLKTLLEPSHNGRFVAIDVVSGEYTIGRSSAAAGRELRSLHPDHGSIVVMRIGSEPDYSLAARALGSVATGSELK